MRDDRGEKEGGDIGEERGMTEERREGCQRRGGGEMTEERREG